MKYILEKIKIKKLILSQSIKQIDFIFKFVVNFQKNQIEKLQI